MVIQLIFQLFPTQGLIVYLLLHIYYYYYISNSKHENYDILSTFSHFSVNIT